LPNKVFVGNERPDAARQRTHAVFVRGVDPGMKPQLADGDVVPAFHRPCSKPAETNG
jgi:hypothetical protein